MRSEAVMMKAGLYLVIGCVGLTEQTLQVNRQTPDMDHRHDSDLTTRIGQAFG